LSARRGWLCAGVGQRWAASWCGAEGLSAVGAQGLVACTVSAKMGGALVGRGGGARSWSLRVGGVQGSGSDGRRRSVEGRG